MDLSFLRGFLLHHFMKHISNTYTIMVIYFMKKIILYLLLFLFVLSIFSGATTIDSSLKALYLWMNTLVPSFLFPFILVRLLTPYHLLYPILKPFDKLLQFIFHIDAIAMESILTSLLLGFPSSSIYLNELAMENKLNQAQYDRLLYCVFLASPNFILISLNTIYPNHITRTLLMIQLICIALLLLCTRNIPLNFKIKTQPVIFFEQLSNAITQSFTILFMILAYLLIIYVIIDLSTFILPDIIKTPLKLLGEFSSGCFYLADLNIPKLYKLLVTSMLLSYGGLCVHMQIINSVDHNHFQYNKFLSYRSLHMILAIILTYFAFG